MGEARLAVRAGRAAVALACLLAASLAWAISARPVSATEDVTAQRLAGGNRYATAAGIALSSFPDGAGTVVLVSGESFPDALAGAALAGSAGGPVLLTARDHLSPEADQAMDELGAESVVILGGQGAVSTAVESDLEGRAVTRVSGADRFETAAAAARRIGAAGIGTVNGLRTAVIASGASFADALAGGGIANAGSGSGVHPVLLVGSSVPPSTAGAIEELGIEQVVILGGSAAVAPEVEADLESRTGHPAVRLAGADRYATGVAVAEAMIADFGSPATTVLLASGEGFADALAGGVLSGRTSAPILLTPRVALADGPEAFLVDHASTVNRIIAIGGTTAVSETALDQAEAAAETVPEDEAAEEDADDTPMTVAPGAAATQQNNTSRSYTASGLADLDEVDIVLLPCANVTASSTGHTFRNSNANDVADGGAETGSSPDRATTVARLTSVNGASMTLTNDDYADDVVPKSDGTVGFVVSGPSSSTASGGCVRPVVFDDADGDNALDTTTANPSTGAEDLAVGGATTFNPQSASGGTGGTGAQPRPTTYRDRYVARNDEAGDSYSGCRYVEGSGIPDPRSSACLTFRYDSNDVFRVVGGKTVSLLEFETRLSTDDDIDVSYFSSAAGSSTFTLTDASPSAPEIVDGRETSEGVRLLMRESQSAADWYRLDRAVVAAGAACPARGELLVEIADGTDLDGDGDEDTELPAPMEPYTDGDVTAGRTYCYFLYALHEFDEGTPDTFRVTTAGETGSGGDPDPLPVIEGLVAELERGTSSTVTSQPARR